MNEHVWTTIASASSASATTSWPRALRRRAKLDVSEVFFGQPSVMIETFCESGITYFSLWLSGARPKKGRADRAIILVCSIHGTHIEEALNFIGRSTEAPWEGET